MDVLSTGLFATSVMGAIGGSSYFMGCAIAAGVFSGGVLPAVGLIVGGCFVLLGRASK